ncbi:MAG: hypothetical protein AB7S38_32640 [Vulcanimicrobiota bacterium]
MKKKHVCSCGRTFAHAISLKRHRFVSGCEETGEEADDIDVEEAPVAALMAEEPVDDASEIVTSATEALSVEQIQALQQLANSRLSPVPTFGFRMQHLAQGSLDFSREFFGWLVEESSNVVGWGRQTALPAAGEMLRKAVLSVATVAMLSVLFFGGITLGLSIKQASANSTPPTGRLGDAGQSVVDFYRAVNARAYSAAYGRLSSDWKRELSQNAFERGYAPVQQVDCRLVGIKALDANTARVSVELAVIEKDQVKNISGHYIVVYDGRGWNLDGSHLTL